MRIIFVFAALIIFVVTSLVLHKRGILSFGSPVSSSAISSAFLTLQECFKRMHKRQEYTLKQDAQKLQAKPVPPKPIAEEILIKWRTYE